MTTISLRLPLILASASPRRAELLQTVGIPFEVVASDVEEPTFCPGRHTPEEFVKATALSKMRSVAQMRPERLILAADTTVMVNERGLGKPVDENDAVRMLLDLSGKTHQVLTGIAMGCQERERLRHRVECALTHVTFRSVSREMAEAYVTTDEPMDKAGAYGIQGKGACLVERIEGCYFNVVGLPLSLLAMLLEEFRVSIPRLWSEISSKQAEGDAGEVQ